MNFLKHSILAILLATTLIPGAASAALDSVKDKNNNHVLDKNGNCVRTKWEVATDPCVEGSDPIKAIMAMEERKLYFDFDKHDLKESEKHKLHIVAEAIKHHKLSAVKIVGYTDRIGTDSYNHKLSHKRADTVAAYLNSLVKLNSSIVEIRGLGKSHQVKDCKGVKPRNALIECLAPNRRVELEVDYISNNIAEPKQ
jgi:OOP family OmpA-OmpF porin